MTALAPEVIAAIQEAFDTALAHYRAGQFEAAEELYRAILQLDPQHPNTNYNLGLLVAQFNRIPEALHFLKTALMAAPQEGKFWVSYLEALASAGDYETARQALELGRRHGLHPSSELVARIELAQSPVPPPATVTPVAREDAPEPARMAIRQALLQKDYQTLETLGQAAVAAWPGAMSGWQALSLARYHTGRVEEALEPTQKLVELYPENAQTHANLGLMLMTLRRLPEAEVCLLRAIALDPKVADSHTNLGTVRRDQNRNDEAEICYRRALVLEPNHAIAHANLGTVLNERGDFRGAEASLRTALTLDPDNAAALGTLATALVKIGNLEEAETILRRAIELRPDHLLAYNLLLFVLNYTHTNQSREALELAVRFGELAAQKTSSRYTKWNCDPAPQRLKIGVVSGDLRSHPIGYFIEALLRHIDPTRMEFIAYSSMPQRKYDGLTGRLHSMFSTWHDIHPLSPELAASQIHADGIHVLLDLSGHTTDNRLMVFAMKPAPVQASWLGYFATTGVAEMDAFIGDPWLCPQEEEKDFTEKVWRLPQTWLCFTPPETDIAVAELPSLQNGYITFACFNNLNKMNDAVVALWAELLHQVPTSKLFLKAPQFADADVPKQTQARFAVHGIAAERLVLEGPSTRTDYLAAYAKADICLDPFPYPGGTTSVESLWMGVPVLTLRGNRFLSHLGESIAHNAGLPDWIATDADDYIAKAVQFAANPSSLATLRAGLRERMLASPLLDAPRFAQDFTDLLWAMWNKKDVPRTSPPSKPTLHKQPSSSEVEQLQQLFRKRRYAELEKKGARLAQRYPHAVAGWKALSLAQNALGKLEAALTATQKLLELLPDEAISHARLGAIFADLKRIQEAEASLLHALSIDPKLADAYANLGYVRRHQKRLNDAAACYRQAIEINPAHAIAHYNLGAVMLSKRDYRAAEQSFRAALALESNDIRALLGLVGSLSNLGLLHEAETEARRLIELQPDNATAYSMLLFILNYGHNTDAAFELVQRYGAMLTRSIKHRYTNWTSEPEPRRLKIGLVSGDLYNHPVSYFLEGLLRELNPERVEIIAYVSCAERHDDTSTRLQAYCSAWKIIDDLNDDAAAALIHDDGIHILIDLAGHTGNNRLPVFARKPAPIQASWLGYFATTGVPEIDFFIGDPNVCPPGEEHCFTETILRLPETYLCFTPPEVDVPINPLPALSNGHITYGCFNNAAKLDDEVIALWSRILKHNPTSRLLLKAKQFDDAAMRARLLARFTAHGITEKQLELEGRTPRKDYFAAYNRIDIALDPFPYPGGTTSVEALWMGVPVLTMRGQRFLSHAGENIMRNLGLPEWIAQDDADYLAKAIAFAADTNALSALRARLRSQALASPMFDAPRFARFFEEMLWDMWRPSQSGTTTQSPASSIEQDPTPTEPHMDAQPQTATAEQAQPPQPNRFVWQQYLDVESADVATNYHTVGRPDLAALYTNQPSLALDIGCAAGVNAALIKERFPGSRVWGIETNRAAAEIAQTKLDRVLVGMFEEFDLEQEGIAKGTLDAVLLADVLEHMYNPWRVMTTLRPYMSPTGQLVLSIPNVRNMVLMDQLSKGNWTYEGAGLLDITHIRFFTFQECLKFCKETGYRVVQAQHALDGRLKSVWESNMAISGPTNINLDRLVLKDVTRAELLEMCCLQFYFLLEKAPD